MEQFLQQNPLVSPPSQSSPGITNLGSTPLSPPSVPSSNNSSQSSHPPRDPTPRRPSETTQVTVYPSSVSLRVCINKKKKTFLKIFFSYY